MVGERLDFGVRSVELALDVLEAIAFSGEELGVTQIAAQVGATKGSVHRHLITLVERGYLTQNPATTRYRIGAKGYLLSHLAPDADLIQIAESAMRKLRDLLGHTVVLTSFTPRGALVLATMAGTSPIEIGVRPGSELSFHASAQGKVLLAFAPEAFRQRILNGRLQSFTPKTVADRETVTRELSQVAKNFYAAAPEQAILGINAVAAPIFDRANACVAAVATVGSIQFLPTKTNKAVIASLRNCAEEISLKIGFGRRPGSQEYQPRASAICSANRRPRR